VRRAAAAALLGCLAVPATVRAEPPAPHSIPWFLQNPGEHRAWLRRCGNDWRLARTDICRNAESAASRRLGRPLPPPPPDPWYRPADPRVPRGG
jgi:hypothetical protein